MMSSDHVRGPYSATEIDAEFGIGGWRPLERFMILQSDKCRPIDSGKRPGHNAAARERETIFTTSVDAFQPLLLLVREWLSSSAFAKAAKGFPCFARFMIGTEDITQKVSFYDAFRRSTRPIHCKKRAWLQASRPKCVFYDAFRRVPGQSVVKIEAPNGWKKCATLPRVQSIDHANPWEGLLRHAKRSGKCVILLCVFAFDLANPWEGRVTPTMCHFTTRFDARPGQSMVGVAFPTEASELAPALERIFKLEVRDLSRDLSRDKLRKSS